MNEVTEPPTTATYRQPIRQGVMATGAAVFLLIGCATFVTYSNRSLYEAEQGFYDYDSWFVATSRLFYGLIAVISLVLLIRVLRAGVFVSERGVVFHNIRRTHHLMWQEIAEPQPPTERPGLSLRLVDGTEVRSSLFGADNPFYKQAEVDRVRNSVCQLRPR